MKHVLYPFLFQDIAIVGISRILGTTISAPVTG
jgi:hypothetical protein